MVCENVVFILSGVRVILCIHVRCEFFAHLLINKNAGDGTFEEIERVVELLRSEKGKVYVKSDAHVISK